MEIRRLTEKDIDHIAELTPEGWKDITSFFRFYLSVSNCHTFLFLQNDEIIGSGNISFSGSIAWLSHIIVKKNFRGAGVGGLITDLLIREGMRNNCKSILLIATSMGQPVYEKRGFRSVDNYFFLKTNAISVMPTINTEPIQLEDIPGILQMDKTITGEDRSYLLKNSMHGWMVKTNGILRGYYLPIVWEGPVVAEDQEAALALLSVKLKSDPRIVVPEQNKNFINYLFENGAIEFHERGTRMVLGEDISWQPDKIYGRIGGAFG